MLDSPKSSAHFFEHTANKKNEPGPNQAGKEVRSRRLGGQSSARTGRTTGRKRWTRCRCWTWMRKKKKKEGFAAHPKISNAKKRLDKGRRTNTCTK